MMVTRVSTSKTDEDFILQGAMTAAQMHVIAEAFIAGAPETPVRRQLRKVFGKWNLKKYALDFTGNITCRITFSSHAEPELVSYRGSPIAIAPRHASDLVVYITTVEVSSIVPASTKTRPFSVGE